MKIQIQNPFGALALLALLSNLDAHLSTAFAKGTTAFSDQGQLWDNGTNADGSDLNNQ